MTVRMTHPDLPGQAIEVPESAVPTHRASGWRTEEENGYTAAPPAPAPAPAASKRQTPVAPNTGKE